jgi:hypothetical protein
MRNTCGNCQHWRLNIQPAAYKGTCTNFNDATGRCIQMDSDDFCSHYIKVETCHKEPEHGDHTNLWASMFELQNKVQDLGLKIDVHSIDESRHLRRPI